jgi:ELWxxDGT repeat protein
MRRYIRFFILVFFLSVLACASMADEPVMYKTSVRGPSGIAALGNGVLFLVHDGSGCVLLKNDGTPSGTLEIKRIKGASPGRLIIRVDDVVFFTTELVFPHSMGEGETYSTLWITDGTDKGTHSLDTDSAPFYRSGVPQGVRQPSPGSLFLDIIGAGGKFFIVKSKTGLDGENPVSALLFYQAGYDEPRIVYTAPGVPALSQLTIEDGKLYFIVKSELWESDGTPQQTRKAPLSPNRSPQARNPSPKIGGSLIYSQSPQGLNVGFELCRSDANGEGAILIKDINPGSADSYPAYIVQARDLLFFTADDGRHGRELWKSDGTDQGTRLVKDITPGAEDSNIISLVAADDAVYFLVDMKKSTRKETADQLIIENHSQIELWKSDGSESGTARLIVWQDTDFDFFTVPDTMKKEEMRSLIP